MWRLLPFADLAPVKVDRSLSDEHLLFLTDVFPTGWMAAVNCDIQPSDVVAVWGCGPVGQFCIKSALMLGARRVIAIDRAPERLAMARSIGAETIDFEDEDDTIPQRLKDTTNGRGPDKCIDAVGAEAHATGSIDSIVDKAKATLMLATDRAHALRTAIMACRPGGVVSIPGVYVGFVDKVPIGAAMNKGLTIRTGQTHVSRYLPDLLRRIESGEVDPTFVITHRAKLEDGPALYKTFRDKQDGCVKAVLSP